MAIGWNPFSPILLGIDLSMLIWGAFAMRWSLRRLNDTSFKASRAVAARLLVGASIAIVPWLVGRFVLGGMLGLSLLARALWTLSSLGVPFLALWLYRKWRRPELWLFVVLPLCGKVYGEWLEPNWLEIERIELTVPGIRESVRIVHLSDLQTDGIRAMHARARAAANAFEPDVVLFTGDVLNHPSLIDEVREYLLGFRHKRGHFFVTGNVDWGFDVPAFVESAGMTLLDERVAVLPLGNARVALLGVGLAASRQRGSIEALLRAAEDADLRLLMSHVPDTAFEARSLPIDVVLAGHTHGGQVSTPFGPLVTLSRVPRRIAAGGAHVFDGLDVIVSRGLGLEGKIAPRVRTFSRPHLILLTLVPK